MNKLIEKYEGKRLIAYKCPANIWTIGFGSTHYENGSKVKEFDEITEEKAFTLLYNHIEKEIMDKLPAVFKCKLHMNQLESVQSLVYNIGVSAFINSSLYKAIMENDLKSIAKNWDWYSANGKVLRGLIKRRSEELYNFMNY